MREVIMNLSSDTLIEDVLYWIDGNLRLRNLCFETRPVSYGRAAYSSNSVPLQYTNADSLREGLQ
jgi:hypothetical protein